VAVLLNQAARRWDQTHILPVSGLLTVTMQFHRILKRQKATRQGVQVNNIIFTTN